MGLLKPPIFKKISDIEISLGEKVSYPIVTGEVGVTNKIYNYGDVRRYGATGDGITDDYTACDNANTSAKALKIPLVFPTGVFVLSSPLLLGSSSIVKGNGNATQAQTYSKTILKPTTTAFTIQSAMTQYESITISDLAIQGGTIQIDIPFCHNLVIERVTFQDFDTALTFFRGERNSFKNLCFISLNKVATYCMNFKDITNTRFSTELDGWSDLWIDLSTFKDINFLGCTTYRLSKGIYAEQISDSTLDRIVFHWFSNTVIDSSFYRCNLLNIQFDNIGTSGSPVTNVVYTKYLQYCTIENVNIGISANIYATNKFNTFYVIYTTFISCRITGDNSTTYGFYLSPNTNQNAIFICCSGAFYSASTTSAQKVSYYQFSRSYWDYNNISSLVNDTKRYIGGTSDSYSYSLQTNTASNPNGITESVIFAQNYLKCMQDIYIRSGSGTPTANGISTAYVGLYFDIANTNGNSIYYCNGTAWSILV